MISENTMRTAFALPVASCVFVVLASAVAAEAGYVSAQLA